ncbi:MAG: hypothetical protein M3Y55_02890, partial [Pseudomonadota bacterium]|nr:hypothetical protein [Pseudomonadota bacterium]
LALHRGFLKHATDAVAVAILRHMVEDKERHVAFGWRYLAERAVRWSDQIREEIERETEQVLEGLVYAGYICPWLAPQPLGLSVTEADIVTRRAGLGAMLPAEEKRIVDEYLSEARDQLLQLNVQLRGVIDA